MSDQPLMRCAAFRHKPTGRVVEVGFWHDVNRLLEMEGTKEFRDRDWSAGFVHRDSGKFLTRRQAARVVLGPAEVLESYAYNDSWLRGESL
jgi:hypothetical protein